MSKGLFDDVDDDSFEGDELFGSAKRGSSDLFGSVSSSFTGGSNGGLFESSSVSTTSLVGNAPLFSSTKVNNLSSKRQTAKISSNLFGDDDGDYDLDGKNSSVDVSKPNRATTGSKADAMQAEDNGNDSQSSEANNAASETNAKAVEAFGEEWAYSMDQNLSEGRRASFGVRDASEVLADFSKWFGSAGRNKESLVSSAISGDLRNSKIRSIAWRIFMDILPPLENSSLEVWLSTILSKREEYRKLMKKYKTDPTNVRMCSQNNFTCSLSHKITSFSLSSI